MGNDFSDDHPMLGSFLGFDHDDSADFGEGMAMAGVLGAYADEATRDFEGSIWDIDDDVTEDQDIAI